MSHSLEAIEYPRETLLRYIGYRRMRLMSATVTTSDAENAGSPQSIVSVSHTQYAPRA